MKIDDETGEDKNENMRAYGVREQCPFGHCGKGVKKYAIRAKTMALLKCQF